MGVPKFFRYISERYPCLTELIKEYQIPEFDNLYLDMNGIIHMCSHPDDNDPHFRITEEKIFADIFHYIEVLFHMIKPHKLFFMAIDGVAPRAKMNQQRGRRFRTAKEAEKMEQKAKEKGESMPEQARFDSNCITPGTVFMAKLQEQLKYFIVNKISTDPLWQKCKIILSGHETPGEGEHKVMDYIRYLRSQPNHDPNTRHCLYGLDADLIMLGLCTHEPHFSLLREEVKFGKKNSQKRKNVPEQITFYLLHLSLMREYLEQEFIAVKDQLSFGYSIESIIDDWVLMGFLVGNDFIPHLPNLHIANGALPLLYNAYMKVLPSFDGYINENGKLHLERFEKFMAALCSIDMEQFTEQYADLKYFESKTGRRPNEKERTSYKPRKLEEWQGDEGDEGMFGALEGEDVKPMKSDLAALIKATEDMFVELPPSEENLKNLGGDDEEESEEVLELDSESCSEDDLLDAEFKLHKQDYYMNKLLYEQVTPEVMRAQAEGYVRAIQWNLNYYYNGVCSWSWYYEHHYAPFISDIKDFKDLKIEFDYGKPFMPYEQLLGVLPTASKNLLPACYHPLMEDASSAIVDYYPTDFNTDLNGKKQDWEAVVLIPFIDENRLLAAMATCNDKLTPDEVRRNRHGPMLVFEYTTDDLEMYEAPEFFPAVTHNHALCTEIATEEIRVPVEKLVKSAYPGALFDVYYPGFPTTKHLKYKSFLRKGGVKVFDQPSRGETLYLELEPPADAPVAEKIASELLGNIVFVSWPHLVEALVVSISTEDYRYHYGNIPGEFSIETNKGNVGHNWQIEKNGIIEHYRDKRGIEVGETTILVHCRVMTGRKYVFTSQGRINLEKQWADTTNAYPLQAIVKNITQYNPEYKPYQNIEDVFTVNSTCFMLGLPHYGYQGTIQDSSEALKKGRVKLELTVYDEPDLHQLYKLEQNLSTSYFPVHVAATMKNISKRLFSRITGTILIYAGAKREGLCEDAPKHNVGLNLKFNKKNEEIPGYTKKESAWLYSRKAIDLVCSYQEKYPQLFHFLETGRNCDVYYEYEIFPEDNGSGETLKEIVNWLKAQEYFSIERQPCGSSTLEPDVVKKLEAIVDEHLAREDLEKSVVMQVKPFLLYKPGLLMGNLPPDPKATFRLYDRVVSVRESYTVPLGHVGTVIAVHKSATGKPEDFLYDVVFDKPFPGGLALNCSPLRGYKMSRLSLINRSHGVREMEMKTGKPGQLYQKIGFGPSPFGGSTPKFYNTNQNSAFAAWNNQPSPQDHGFGRPAAFPGRNANHVPAQPSQEARPNANGGSGTRKNAKQAKSSQPVDFMPFKKQTAPTAEEGKSTQALETATNQVQQQQVKVQKTPKKNEMSPMKPPQPPVSTSSSSSAGVSLTANDLFAHVSAQMQKMNITAPQTAALPFPPSLPTTSIPALPFAPPVPQTMAFPPPMGAAPPPQGQNKAGGFGIQLLSECQRRGLGCPLYQYYQDRATQMYQAQLKLSFLKEPIFGVPAPSKAEATERAAEMGLQQLPPQPPPLAPLAFPAPPMQWCMPNMNNPSASRPIQPHKSAAGGPPPQPPFMPRMPQPQQSAQPSPPLHIKQQQFQQQMQQLQQQQFLQKQQQLKTQAPTAQSMPSQQQQQLKMQAPSAQTMQPQQQQPHNKMQPFKNQPNAQQQLQQQNVQQEQHNQKPLSQQPASQPEKKQTPPRQSVPFVPLQAVKQQRIHRNSNSSQQAPKKNARKNEEKRTGPPQAGQEKSPRTPGKVEKDKDEAKEKDENKGKPRRQRKPRIAANFSIPP